jgi:putative transposase
LNAQSAQVTLKRVDLALNAFFRRVREGETPGFPRFKLYDRFPGFGYKHHGDGFRFTPGKGWKHGKLRLSGVGTMQARGEARTPGKIVRADIMRKAETLRSAWIGVSRPSPPSPMDRGSTTLFRTNAC